MHRLVPLVPAGKHHDGPVTDQRKCKRQIFTTDVAREPGLHRNTVTLLYNETAARVDLEAVDKLCGFFSVTIGELFERLPDANSESTEPVRM